MLMNMLKRVMIYGYLLFVGYQAFLLIQSGADKKFLEIIDNFEARHSKVFDKVYQFVPQLAQRNLKYIKYPAAKMGFSGISILIGYFGLYALASHAFYTYLTNPKIVNFVHSVSLKKNINDVVQLLDLEIILFLAIYLGIVNQVISGIFCEKKSSCCSGAHVEPTLDRQQPRARK